MSEFPAEFRDNPVEAARHRKNLIKLIQDFSGKYHQWQIFSDFVEMAAISVSNAVDLPQWEKREARYLEIAKRYDKAELEQFPKMLAELVGALETEPHDCLGMVFHELELHNKWTGQYLSPFQLCEAVAKMTLSTDDAKGIIAERGFVTASEPACGSGAMIIGLAKSMRDAGINYQQHLHVTAVDIDPKCVHMAYLQFALLHIPAIVVHGNTLGMEVFGEWRTPARVLGLWEGKSRRSPEHPLLEPDPPDVSKIAEETNTSEEHVQRVDDAPAPPSEPPKTHVERIKASKPVQLKLF